MSSTVACPIPKASGGDAAKNIDWYQAPSEDAAVLDALRPVLSGD